MVVVIAALLSACDGCRPPAGTPKEAGGEALRPTARLYLVSDLAGALEPCGCVKDQLGGMDHFGALVAETRDAAMVARVAASRVSATRAPKWSMPPS